MNDTPADNTTPFRPFTIAHSSSAVQPAVITFGRPANIAEPPTATRLRHEVRGIAGLVALQVEERVHPLWLRAGTDDVEEAIAALDPTRRGFKCAHQPRRILEIGAGAGYRSIALAVEYPEAEILAAEADPALQRTGLLNTLPYNNITYVTTAISTDEARYGYFGRKGAAGRLALMQHAAGPVRAQPLRHFLHYRHFNNVDTLIISPDAASDHILRGSLPASLRLIAVETNGAPLPEATAQFFPPPQFLTVMSGDYVLLYRRGTKPLAPEPLPVQVFTPDGPARALTLENIMPDGFFPLGGGGFRLHPNEAGAPPARLTLSVENLDYSELQISLRVALETARPVRFTVKMLTERGTILATGTETVPGGAARVLVLNLSEHQGRCEIIFTTEMAEPDAANHGAWAEIISATLI